MDDDAFVKVASDGSGFTRYGKPYYISGANYWQGISLGANDCYGGDRDRMETEIKQMADMGINNLRVMASAEGPDDQPYRMRPSFMTKPGEYKEAVFEGLDYLLDAMDRHNMTAVMTLNNFWQWSGGFAQYVAWVLNNQTIPYPEGDENWNEFTVYAARFYNDSSIADKAQDLFKDHIKAVQTRVNTVNGKKYNEDPVIMSWQLANEPQEAPEWWFEETSDFIKKNAPKQLVSAGLESKLDQYDFNRAHDHKNIDYTTCHLWVENWEIYDPANESSLADAQAYAKDYISSRAEWAAALKKPIIMEEFGMVRKKERIMTHVSLLMYTYHKARDAFNHPDDDEYKYDPSTPTTHKDAYYKGIFDQILELAKENKFSGSNFWAYGGLGRSTDYPNQYGMVILGDPPHERRGWYSVYDKDTSTIDVIKNYNDQLKELEEQ
ncbi:glycoside hydrolase family 5 protein [Lichtheimia corymbifera JMRC:FSU:9682]|uniref:mannan endo-1,4-beta-mannosidase n=1 Tax=Lichtheimia corymbifera JMRC:FSU:9682 TaxID=1263082 RepID=A0A068RVU0_9FUNG|nr:glycoside hydrolase family 5 protein [Lichtheimia corymbifera JMRC:FSU:9682]